MIAFRTRLPRACLNLDRHSCGYFDLSWSHVMDVVKVLKSYYEEDAHGHTACKPGTTHRNLADEQQVKRIVGLKTHMVVLAVLFAGFCSTFENKNIFVSTLSCFCRKD